MAELEHKADEAWRAMCAGTGFFDRANAVRPMPAGVAIDMVQDVCGERDDAVCAILGAAARWLESEFPADDFQNAELDAVAVIGDIRGEAFGLAESLREAIMQRAGDVRLARVLGRSRVPDATFETAIAWSKWCERAALAIKLCRELAPAAHPDPT